MKVRFTRPAQADLQRIYVHISRYNPTAAAQLVTRLIERAWALGDSPFDGRQTDEPNTHVIVVPRLRYFIFYTVKACEVHITHIRHNSRQRPPGW